MEYYCAVSVLNGKVSEDENVLATLEFHYKRDDCSENCAVCKH
jgi:hypothetical protein